MTISACHREKKPRGLRLVSVFLIMTLIVESDPQLALAVGSIFQPSPTPISVDVKIDHNDIHYMRDPNDWEGGSPLSPPTEQPPISPSEKEKKENLKASAKPPIS